MKVRCVTTNRGDAAFAKLGLEPRRGMHGDFSAYVTIGEEYLVFGVETEAYAEEWKDGPRVLVRPYGGRGLITSLPFSLFEVSDPRASRHWHMDVLTDGAVLVMQPELYDVVTDETPSSIEDEEAAMESYGALGDKLARLREAEWGQNTAE